MKKRHAERSGPRAAGPHPGDGDGTISPRRRRIYTLVTLVLPLALLGLAEGGLRVAGFGDIPLFVPFPEAPGYLQVNPRIGLRYFPPEQARPPAFDVFRAERAPNSLRIVVQGASTAVGFPYGHHLAFGRLLRRKLQAVHPGTRVEVVNTALTAVNSHTLRDLVPEIIDVDPDAVIIYAGHNEYYGAFGVGSSVGGIHAPPLVRAYLVLRRSRIVELVRRAVARARRPPETAGDPRLHRPMREVVASERIAFGSPLYRAGIEQYRANLHAILGAYERRGIPVFVATLASNDRDQPPLSPGPVSAGADRVVWRDRESRARGALRRGEYGQARILLDSLIAEDSLAASPVYLLAALLDARSRPDSARRAYRRARDLDPLRFRAPEALNDVIRSEAAEHDAVVVDVRKRMEDASPGQVIGASLMTEHVHPNLRGAGIMADAFFEHVEKLHFAEEGPGGEPPPVDLATPLDSVLAAYRIRALTSGWPFRPDGGGPALDVEPRTPVDSLAMAVYEGRLLWIEAMNEQGAHFESTGDARGALTVALAMGEELPFSPFPLLAAGRIAFRETWWDEALDHFRAANRRERTAYGMRMEALTLLAAGRRDEALQALRIAASVSPGDERTARALQAARALPRLHKALDGPQAASGPDPRVALAYALRDVERTDLASRLVNEVLRDDPRHPDALALRSELERAGESSR